MEVKQLNKLLANPALLDKATLDELKILVEKYPFFQAAWLLYLKNLKQIKSSEFESVLKKAAIRMPDRKLLFKFLNTNFYNKQNKIEKESTISVGYKLEDEVENQPGDSLIDKFLSAKPGVIRQSNENERAESSPHLKDVEAKSIGESDEIITETLAILYFQQKNYERALDAYNKLSLKYPEKSVYFATRIEEIEKLKNI